ncbi:hypothetical protein JCM5353_000953 [Sporobolomyces roseus]
MLKYIIQHYQWDRQENYVSFMQVTEQEHDDCRDHIRKGESFWHLPVWNWNFEYFQAALKQLHDSYNIKIKSDPHAHEALPNGWQDILNLVQKDEWEAFTHVEKAYCLNNIRNVIVTIGPWPRPVGDRDVKGSFVGLAKYLEDPMRKRGAAPSSFARQVLAGEELKKALSNLIDRVKQLRSLTVNALLLHERHTTLTGLEKDQIRADELKLIYLILVDDLRRVEHGQSTCLKLTRGQYVRCLSELLLENPFAPDFHNPKPRRFYDGSALFEFVWIRSASFGIFCFERKLEFLIHEDNPNHNLAPLLTAVTEERWNSTNVDPSLRAKIIKLMALDRPGPSPNLHALKWVHGIPSFPDRHLLATSLEELLELTPKHSLAHTPISRRLVQRLI